MPQWQVSVSVLCIAGPMRLVHIHRKARTHTAILSANLRQALQERGFSVPFSSDNPMTPVNAQQLFTEATMRRGYEGQQGEILSVIPRPNQALDLAINVEEAGVSVLVDRSELIRLRVQKV
eukprot:3264922-Prymnesium_polylepis.1